ncbi:MULTISPECIES: inositol monophosphatase family protein [unclassified Sulfitobacter]|uniref:inositol monophosphatase family protein n=1 Tax=unclassified Sulfitobacter TaxID=196795 RepID=UPI0007C29EC5|nr:MULTISPECIES: 3'(2'),5'-bisphosphate nucleotidase CysQ [unclassified Sulfitobacter]KZX99687.1 3'(2'),5'-bisphosphate nucleotidase CysQ [Sulfitobacter sp. HI0023]KZY27437.1 3'(2'),5'-bisphosphate nucleotidase CysQ [Sulfitobacter sp. HI0040]KZZ70878.1 3'(2'),5'-bisphosphate nucleotidase CysQ [Sulfitobacter sp. HI0129]
MPERDDLALLIDAARMSGRVATSYAGARARRWDKPGGLGPVTEADLAVNDLLHAVLRPARPDYGWLSEESEDTQDRLSREAVFIVDPIDGTRSFVEGSDTWAHSLAVARGGWITAAVVYLPLRGLLYAAARGRGATLNGVALQASQEREIARAEVLAAKPALALHHWRGEEAPHFKRAYRPSLAYRLALVAEGAYDAMLTLRHSWEWDIAAGALIIAEAGGAASNRRGDPLRFNNPDPRLDGVVAGGLHVHRSLIDALA